MTEEEAQNVAFRMANLNSLEITLQEIRSALVCLANWYEDTKGRVARCGNCSYAYSGVCDMGAGEISTNFHCEKWKEKKHDKK